MSLYFCENSRFCSCTVCLTVILKMYGVSVIDFVPFKFVLILISAWYTDWKTNCQLRMGSCYRFHQMSAVLPHLVASGWAIWTLRLMAWKKFGPWSLSEDGSTTRCHLVVILGGTKCRNRDSGQIWALRVLFPKVWTLGTSHEIYHLALMEIVPNLVRKCALNVWCTSVYINGPWCTAALSLRVWRWWHLKTVESDVLLQ